MMILSRWKPVSFTILTRPSAILYLSLIKHKVAQMSSNEINQQTRQNSMRTLAQETFLNARKQGTWHSLKNRLLRKPNRLESYADVTARGKLSRQHELGTQPVEIKQIVGSMGRVDDFDRQFHPRNSLNFERWMNIALAFQKGVALPAVELFKIDNQYFVKDGHHRISVASSHGQTFIDAAVTEIVLC